MFDHILFAFIPLIIEKLHTRTHVRVHTQTKPNYSVAFHGPFHLSYRTMIYVKTICSYKDSPGCTLTHTHTRWPTSTQTDTHTGAVLHTVYDSSLAKGILDFLFGYQCFLFLIDDLYCNYLSKGRNRIIRKGPVGRKVLIRWEFCPGRKKKYSAEGEKVHASPQNSVSASGWWWW